MTADDNSVNSSEGIAANSTHSAVAALPLEATQAKSVASTFVKSALLVGFVVLGLGLHFLVSSCISLHRITQAPKVTLQGVEIQEASLSHTVLNCLLHIENPNDAKIEVDRVKYELTVDGQTLTSDEYKKPISIPEHGSTDLSVSVTVRLDQVFTSALSFLQKGSVPYIVKGSVSSGLLSVPFEHNGQLELAKLLSK